MADDFDGTDHAALMAELTRPAEQCLPRLEPTHRSAADFPYDPTLRIEDQEGLDRLRCIEWRDVAQQMYEQYVKLEGWWGSEDAERDRERRKRREEDREVARIVPYANKAFKGDISIDAKLLAQRVLFPDGYVPLNRTMLPALREFARCFAELKRSGKA